MGSIDKACISGFLCRLCSEMHRIVIHIYGDRGQRLCLVEKINGYLPITISPTDPLPKTICTTCLRRIEQHYDLLLRLSIIRKERLRRKITSFNNNIQLRDSPISSPNNSDDEVNRSDDESRRRQNQRNIPPQQDPQTSQNCFSTPAFNDNGANDVQTGASTSASAMETTAQHINVLNDTNIDDSSSSSSSHSIDIENGNMAH